MVPAKDFKRRMVVEIDGAPHMIEHIQVQTPSGLLVDFEGTNGTVIDPVSPGLTVTSGTVIVSCILLTTSG